MFRLFIFAGQVTQCPLQLNNNIGVGFVAVYKKAFVTYMFKARETFEITTIPLTTL